MGGGKTCSSGSHQAVRVPNNIFGKRLDRHVVAVSLYVACNNLCLVREALRETPAMALGIADHAWPISDLLMQPL